MTKLFDCPYCEKKQVPLRNDAEACSNKCRKRKQRIKDKANKVKDDSDKTLSVSKEALIECSNKLGE